VPATEQCIELGCFSFGICRLERWARNISNLVSEGSLLMHCFYLYLYVVADSKVARSLLLKCQDEKSLIKLERLKRKGDAALVCYESSVAAYSLPTCKLMFDALKVLKEDEVGPTLNVARRWAALHAGRASAMKHFEEQCMSLCIYYYRESSEEEDDDIGFAADAKQPYTIIKPRLNRVLPSLEDFDTLSDAVPPKPDGGTLLVEWELDRSYDKDSREFCTWYMESAVACPPLLCHMRSSTAIASEFMEAWLKVHLRADRNGQIAEIPSAIVKASDAVTLFAHAYLAVTSRHIMGPDEHEAFSTIFVQSSAQARKLTEFHKLMVDAARRCPEFKIMETTAIRVASKELEDGEKLCEAIRVISTVNGCDEAAPASTAALATELEPDVDGQPKIEVREVLDADYIVDILDSLPIWSKQMRPNNMEFEELVEELCTWVKDEAGGLIDKKNPDNLCSLQLCDKTLRALCPFAQADARLEIAILRGKLKEESKTLETEVYKNMLHRFAATVDGETMDCTKVVQLMDSMEDLSNMADSLKIVFAKLLLSMIEAIKLLQTDRAGASAYLKDAKSCVEKVYQRLDELKKAPDNHLMDLLGLLVSRGLANGEAGEQHALAKSKNNATQLNRAMLAWGELKIPLVVDPVYKLIAREFLLSNCDYHSCWKAHVEKATSDEKALLQAVIDEVEQVAGGVSEGKIWKADIADGSDYDTVVAHASQPDGLMQTMITIGGRVQGAPRAIKEAFVSETWLVVQGVAS
jgi:hypothetical protein